MGWRQCPADNENYQNKHHTRGIERPADKSAGYSYKARLRGLAWVVGMIVILFMFIICRTTSGKARLRGLEWVVSMTIIC
jgi:hypothetical protein